MRVVVHPHLRNTQTRFLGTRSFVTDHLISSSLITSCHILYCLTSQDTPAVQWCDSYTSDNVQWSCWIRNRQNTLWKQSVELLSVCVEEFRGRTSFLERCVWKAATLSLAESLMGAQGWLMSLGDGSLCWEDGQTQHEAVAREMWNTHTHSPSVTLFGIFNRRCYYLCEFTLFINLPLFSSSPSSVFSHILRNCLQSHENIWIHIFLFFTFDQIFIYKIFCST